MQRYDPDFAPDPAQWLELDEGLRIQLAEQYHRKAGIPLPSVRAHAVFHAIIENQLALGVPAVVSAFSRLLGQGLDRHEAVHAVGSALAEHFFELMQSRGGTLAEASQARYEAALAQLDGEEWRRRQGL
ncbi:MULTISPECIES: hypothetical protein [unclassified Rubrivivax]|uniref:hypothetical protein n=1 Tax=unclassified Rubrivivax TaxID=2649762 RepID=UPI001E538F0A|nr:MULTISPECIES: hypothetical protein [unclassified Rubrivivax]MCC9598451.1 hypothetical protein [Rubrivivax sp. JA1055]MCC9648151.1 hypothetical protein [Rubrivivax sp. JA1029]